MIEAESTLNELAKQHLDVGEHRREVWSRHAANIKSLRATPDDVQEWYLACDPLESSYGINLDLASATGQLEEMHKFVAADVEESIIMSHGAAILLASSLFPHEFEDHDGKGNWQDVIYNQYYQPAAKRDLVPRNGRLDTYGIIDLTFARMKEGVQPFYADQVEKLFMAAEMLRYSIGSFKTGIATGHLEIVDSAQAADMQGKSHQILPFKIDAGCNKEEFEAFLAKQNTVSDSILRTLGAMAYSDDAAIESITNSPDEVRLLALKSEALVASSWMSEYFPEPKGERYERAKLEFSKVVDLFTQTFAPGRSIRTRLKNGVVKGGIHEILWFLDAYALRMVDYETYGNVRTEPVFSRVDMPRIGYPHYRRGYDVMVRAKNAKDCVQLKSSNAQQKSGTLLKTPYHPEIVIRAEEDFKEVSPRRLDAKLAVYKRWSESGFDPSMKDTVLKYVMKSVKEEYDDIADRTDDTSREWRKLVAQRIAPIVMQQYGTDVNRAERRRRERAAKKRSSLK